MTTRTRSTDAAEVLTPWQVVSTDPTVPNVSGTVGTVPLFRTMTDVVVLNFKERSAAGEIFNNPMSSSSKIEDWQLATFDRNEVNITGNGGATQKYVGFSGTYWHHGWMANVVGTVPTIDTTRVEQLAITKAYADRNSTDFSAYVALGEAKSTIEWFISIFTRALSFYRNWKKKLTKAENLLRNSKGKAARSAYEDLENLRMEYRYAVVPLAADMEGIANALHGIKLSPRQTFRGYAQDSVSATLPINGRSSTVSGGLHFVNLNGYYTYEKKVECRAGVLTEIDFSVFGNLSRKLGFTQSVAAAYDLLPLSFILNWFINMGDFLLAWQPNAGVSDLAAWRKTTTTITESMTLGGSGTYERSYDGGTANQTSKFSGQAWQRSTVTVDRGPTGIASTAIRFDVNLDFFKILDLITIARNLART